MKASEIKLSYKRQSSNITVTSSNQVDKVIRTYWDLYTLDYFECFVTLFLSRKNEVLGIMKISEGGIDACIVDIRRIFQGALLSNSTSIIIAHNHPSGNLKPSQADIRLTNEIKRAGEILKIKLLDSFIITSSSYFSFIDSGLL